MERRNDNRGKQPRGFTLMELLVVIAIIGILGSVVVVKIRQNPEKARMAKALTEVKQLQLQADSFELDTGKPISSLAELAPKYIEAVPRDPWGGDYVVESTSDGGAKIRCPAYESKASTISSVSIGGGPR